MLMQDNNDTFEYEEIENPGLPEDMYTGSLEQNVKLWPDVRIVLYLCCFNVPFNYRLHVKTYNNLSIACNL